MGDGDHAGAAAAGNKPAARVVLLGPPNSGKGTQAELLAGGLGVPAISTGAMLREAVEGGSELGRRVEGIMQSGELVDDETMAEVVKARLAKPDAGRGFILDGYPRTLAQAETLEGILEGSGREIDAAVSIVVPEEVLVARALGRGRADDREEVLRERLRVYAAKTAPLIGYYRERGLLREVDGDRQVAEVAARVAEVIEASARVPHRETSPQ